MKCLREQNELYAQNRELMNEIRLRDDYSSVDDATKVENLKGMNRQKDIEI